MPGHPLQYGTTKDFLDCYELATAGYAGTRGMLENPVAFNARRAKEIFSEAMYIHGAHIRAARNLPLPYAVLEASNVVYPLTL